jgi:hypothetical protein
LFREEGLEVFKQEFERFLIEHRRSNTTDENQAQARLVDVEREISNIMAAIKAGIITSTTKEMLTQAETERDKLRHALHVPTNKLDKLVTVLPNLVERFRRMLDDLARTTRHEIDKARRLSPGWWGRKQSFFIRLKIKQDATSWQSWQAPMLD